MNAAPRKPRIRRLAVAVPHRVVHLVRRARALGGGWARSTVERSGAPPQARHSLLRFRLRRGRALPFRASVRAFRLFVQRLEGGELGRLFPHLVRKALLGLRGPLARLRQFPDHRLDLGLGRDGSRNSRRRGHGTLLVLVQALRKGHELRPDDHAGDSRGSLPPGLLRGA